MTTRILAACAVLLSACASAPSAPAASAAKPTAKRPAATPADTLPAQTLPAGKCGLFLWTQDEPRRFVLFYPAASATAEAIVNGYQSRLSLDSQKGDVFAQFMTEMDFRNTDGSPVKLTLQPGEILDGGRRVPSARMISQDPEGWEIITPLTGLTACQPE